MIGCVDPNSLSLSLSLAHLSSRDCSGNCFRRNTVRTRGLYNFLVKEGNLFKRTYMVFWNFFNIINNFVEI